jgi:hypothetical protein
VGVLAGELVSEILPFVVAVADVVELFQLGGGRNGGRDGLFFHFPIFQYNIKYLILMIIE